jgi:cytoskeletal protein CcmA (bactofilin family)
MLEVKRKPNNAHVRRASTTAPTYRSENESFDDSLSPESSLDIATAEKLQKSHTPVLFPVPVEAKDQHTRQPVITGEVHCRGMLPVDGVLIGQLGSSSGMLSIRQKCQPFRSSDPELSGDISFRDMVRVNGHIAGTVYSKKGTLIVDSSARVDADVDVAVAVIGGTVNGDIVAHERVELGSAARIRGNIWTRSISIKSGAIFEGVCRMIEDRLEAD